MSFFGISGVAYRFRDTGAYLCLPAPNRHHHLFPAMEAAGIPNELFHDMPNQGFVGEGGFLDRKEALALALRNGFDMANKVGNDEILFSEDLW